MTIEDAIKQKKIFQNEYVRANVNILFTASRLSNHLLHALKPFGITPQQFNILRILKGMHPEPTTVKDLMERMIDKTSNTSRLVDRLLEKKLVERTICEFDRRRVDVVISSKGVELVEKASVAVNDSVNTLFEVMTPKEARTLNDLLDKLK